MKREAKRCATTFIMNLPLKFSLAMTPILLKEIKDKIPRYERSIYFRKMLYKGLGIKNEKNFCELMFRQIEESIAFIIYKFGGKSFSSTMCKLIEEDL